MKRSALVLLLCAASLMPLACDDSSPTEPGESPSWLQALIARIESEPVTNPPSAIFSYRYRGETVYFRPSRCCDVASVLYDRDGNVLCAPDGGITGNGDGRCPDFFAARSEERLVWRDPRN
ncbi:MAG TPA: hypothetical protein VF121_08650 [Thermoanaerobaculia bacterium]|nr:hypothetical protein [Thermoanaerobaculia bacterium]